MKASIYPPGFLCAFFFLKGFVKVDLPYMTVFETVKTVHKIIILPFRTNQPREVSNSFLVMIVTQAMSTR